MRRKSMIWVLMTTLLIPVAWAQDESATAPTAEAKKLSDDSPIPRLMEMKLDIFIVPARKVNLPLPGRMRTVQEVLDQFEAWAEDERVGGVLLDIQPMLLGMSYIQELYQGVTQLREAGKRVFAYANLATPGSYLLATAAEEVAIAPVGFVVIPGVGNVFPYMKGHFQMRGIEFDVITAGKYKYPGFLNRRAPNEYFTESIEAIMDTWYEDYRDMLAKGRGFDEKQAAEVIDEAIFEADAALQRNLVDKLVFLDDYREQLVNRHKMQLRKVDESGLAAVNSIQDLVELINEGLEKARDEKVGPKIAVLHARGPIIDFSLGKAMASQLISRDDTVEIIEELRKNKSIKAVVLHVDSPGGSAYASDVIWQHLRKLDEEKPLVCSMGQIAASGGYYIASPARRIFAHSSTLTGSIGVIGIFQSLWSQLNRMDVELYPLARGERALLGSAHSELSPEDHELIEDWLDGIYNTFLSRVAQSRKMPVEEIDKIAQGRIWSGQDALEVGLIDEIGGLDDAIQAARKMANIPPSAELEIVHYPRPSSLGELFETLNMVSTPSISMLNADPSASLFGTTANRSVEDILAAYQQANSLATVPSFDEQLQFFATQQMPLTWTAIPEFYRPAREIGSGILPIATPNWQPAAASENR